MYKFGITVEPILMALFTVNKTIPKQIDFILSTLYNFMISVCKQVITV